MKILLLFIVLIVPLFGSFPPEYKTLLSKYVKGDLVDYQAWSENEADLNTLKKVTEYFSENTIPKERQAALAWYLNAYNAWILDRILSKYPTKGPISGGDLLFFHKKKIRVAGKKMSFDTLEQKIIRPEFKESRIHFALNCASISCPPLRNEPYEGSKLLRQLNEQTDQFINHNPNGVQVSGKTMKLSKIFDWYAVDFGGKDELTKWVNYYRNPKLQSVEVVKFMDYDWSLNAVK